MATLNEIETSSIDDECFHSNAAKSRRRRNAIDFSPVDARNESVGSAECEVIDDKIIEKNLNDSSMTTNVEKELPVIENSTVIKEADAGKLDNSCSVANNSSHAVSSEMSNLCQDDAVESLTRYEDDSDKDSSGSPVLDEKQYFWKKHRKSRQPSFTTDIFSTDMSLYYTFTKSCHCLSNFSVEPSIPIQAPTEKVSPLQSTAKQLLPILQHSFAYIHGGKDLNNSPIICLPHFSDFRQITEENFRDVLMYLTNVASARAVNCEFVIVLDRRRDKWQSLKSVLTQLASYFSGKIRMVLVLRPVGFLQGPISDLGFRFLRDEFSAKVRMLSLLEELFDFISPDQLTQEFGGTYDYKHDSWIHNRTKIEDFSAQAAVVGNSLDKYGIRLAETELPNDVISTKNLIKNQNELTKTYQAKLEELQVEATALQEAIRLSLDGTVLNPSQISTEIETLQNMTTLVEENKMAFEKFWSKHLEKLQQCLQLRKFEQDYREARFRLTVFEQWFEHQSDSIGTTLSWVTKLLEEAEKLKESFAVCKAECTKLASEGRILIENHCAVDCIAPKCSELLCISSDLAESFKKRLDYLNDVHGNLASVEELNTWCDRAMGKLAGRTVEKASTISGNEQMLLELDSFFDSDNLKLPISVSSVPTCLKNCVVAVNRRLEEVLKLYEKYQASLKSATKPSSKKSVNTENYLVTSVPTPPQIPPVCVQSASSDSHNKLRHVMNELLSTERTYVDELKSIVDGYGKPIDSDEFAHIVPEQLKGKKRVLLGNMEDIYRFHEKIFLAELEECRNEPQLVGQCFVKQKEQFGIYAEYCQNTVNSEQLRNTIGEKHQFFVECQKKLGHRLALSAYLLKPVQRITKYQLLLKQILQSSDSHTSQLQEAVDTMLYVLKSVNDSMHQAAILGYEGDFGSLGQLLMQGPLQVEHKKNKGKNLTRPRFNKNLHRYVFLYEKELLLCKLQSTDTGNETGASHGNQLNFVTPGGIKGQHYVYKTSLKVSGAGLTETVKGDNFKFEIWYQRREDVYSFLATNAQIKQDWLTAFRKALLLQLPSRILPTDSSVPEVKKSTKAKRSQSLNRKSRPVSNAENSKEAKRNSSLNRSASLGKGKTKLIKRKNSNDFKKPMPKTKDESLKECSNGKSITLSRPFDEPSLSDVDEGFDSSTAQTSEISLTGCRFVVMKERTANLNDDEVALHVGDVVQAIQSGKDGWLKVRVMEKCLEGWAPSTNLRSVSDTSSYDSVCSCSSVG